ncbi:MAG: N-acetylneuraminate synthase family protein, partial [Colwellia sp.]
MKTSFKISDREISSQQSPYIIAEISGNHNGSLDRALKIVDAAHQAGAHAIKLQTYTADTMTIESQKPDFMISNGLWAGKSLYELYEWAHTPWKWHEKIFQHAKDLGLTAFSSPFDDTAVDFLESLNVPAYKIASFELTDIPLIKKVALTGKPIILSTGMANLNEIKLAVESIESTSTSPICLLHCVSGYPTPVDEINLRGIEFLKENFKHQVGLSDHTLTTLTSVCATTMG